MIGQLAHQAFGSRIFHVELHEGQNVWRRTICQYLCAVGKGKGKVIPLQARCGPEGG